MKTLVDITKEDVKRRCFAALAVVILLFGGLSARLAYLQLMDYEEMRNQVLDQYSSTMTLPASRGSIYDRNMQPLAISETVETVFISPMGIMKADEAAKHRRLTSSFVISTRVFMGLYLPKVEIYSVSYKVNKGKAQKTRFYPNYISVNVYI